MTIPIWVLEVLLLVMALALVALVVWLRLRRCPSCTSIRIHLAERRASGVEHYVCGKCGHGFTNF